LRDDRRVIDTTDNLVFDPDEATVAPGIPDSAGGGRHHHAGRDGVGYRARQLFLKCGDDYEMS
jgi:hypothetical protein